MIQAPLKNLILLLAVTWILTACAGAGSVSTGQEEPAIDPAPAETGVSTLSASLVEDFLLADIADRRGYSEIAAESMAKAAQASRDPVITTRAFGMAMRAGRYNDALELTRLLQQIQPDSDGPRLAEIQVLVEIGDLGEASNLMIEMAAERDPEFVNLFQDFANMLARHPSPEAALDVYRILVDAYPDLADAHMGLALLGSRTGASDLAIESADRVLSLDPAREDAALLKFSVLEKTGETSAAEAFATEFLKGSQQSHLLRFELARSLARNDHTSEAIEQLRQLTRRQPGNAEALYALGLLYVQDGNLKLGSRTLERHLELRPGNDQTRLYLGQIAVDRERYDEAETWFAEITDEELYMEAQIRLADTKGIQEGPDAAIDHLRQLIPASLDDQIRIYLAQEEVLRENGQLDQALSMLNAALSDLPDSPDLLYARGLLTARLEDIDQHEKDIRRLIELEPDNAHAYNALGYTLADLTDRYQEALTLISQALTLSPEDPFILDSMGWVQYRLGNTDEAIRYLRHALSIREDAEIAAHLGEVLYVTGDTQQAQDIWEMGLEIGPDNEVLIRTIEKFSAQPPK